MVGNTQLQVSPKVPKGAPCQVDEPWPSLGQCFEGSNAGLQKRKARPEVAWKRSRSWGEMLIHVHPYNDNIL